MPEPVTPENVDGYLAEIDRRLREVQLGLAPEREPAPVRAATAAKPPRPEPPRPPHTDEPPRPPHTDDVVTSKLIASMRELLDALESATGRSDRPATH